MYPEREQQEWTNLWWENAEREGTRVLCVGDSISVGYRTPTQKRVEEKYFVDLMATSKFIADASYEKELKYVLSEYPYAVIHFNNGLHGIELSNEKYETYYRKMLDIVLAACPNVILATSTPITVVDDPASLDPVKNAVVLARNEIVRKIAAEYKLPIDDLYSAVLGKAEIKSNDGYHYTLDGYTYISQFVAEAIEASMSR